MVSRVAVLAILLSATVAHAATANLSAMDFADHATVSNGDIVTYTLVATNNGPDVAVNPKLVDTLQASTDFSTVQFLDGTAPSGTVAFATDLPTRTATCTVQGQLAVGETLRCRFTVQVIGVDASVNTVLATNDLEDPTDTGNTGSASTFIQDPPPPTFAPAAIAFGTIANGASGAQAIIATDGDATVFLNVKSITATCGDHATCAIAPDTCTGMRVTPLMTCGFTVTATCLNAGAISGGVTFTDFSTGSPESLPIAGTCMAPVIPTPDYAIAASPQSVTIASGATGSTTLTITPVNGLTGTLALACSGLPLDASCELPASVSLDGSNTPVTVELTVDTALPQSSSRTSGGALLLFGAVGCFGGKRRRGAKLLLLFGILACGGGGGGTTTPHGTPPGSYTITVTATGATTHATTIDLVVD